VLEITAEILEAAASSYHEDRWELQEVRVVVVCGKDCCRCPWAFGEGDDLTWVSVAVFEEKARALVGLVKAGKDGTQRTGLSVSAWQVMPLGGRRCYSPAFTKSSRCGAPAVGSRCD
jgi:hypothetical protein